MAEGNPELPREIIYNIIQYANSKAISKFIQCNKWTYAIADFIWDSYIETHFGKNNFLFLWKEKHGKGTFKNANMEDLFRINTLYMCLYDIGVKKTTTFDKSYLVDIHDMYRMGDLWLYSFKDANGEIVYDGLRKVTPAYTLYKSTFAPLIQENGLCVLKLSRSYDYEKFLCICCENGIANAHQVSKILYTLSRYFP